MKIRNKLSILFTILTATILLAFVFVIYATSRQDRESAFYKRLEKEALTKANLFFKAGIDEVTLQNIYRNNQQIINEVEVAIYDTTFHLLYHDAEDIDFVKETSELIHQIMQNGIVQFYQHEWQVVGMRYVYQNKDYIITATAFDQYGYKKLDTLLKNSLIIFVVAIAFIYLAGRFLSRKAFEPVKHMTDKAKKISASRLDLRLTSNNSRDEISELANTFNEMLNRLEHSFEAQKNFVSNIAHELRTPLAAIITELELSVNKDRNVAEYKVAIHKALSDSTKLARLSNSLLDLAKASYDPSEIAKKVLRIDEVLLDASVLVQRAHPEYKVDIRFAENIDEEETQISVQGNEYLLKVAFVNLIDNGCKFSDNKQCSVSISCNNTDIILQFTDQGIGIPENNLKNIFTPFYRGDNRNIADGNGIGLSLTQKIITLHNGTISIATAPHKGTTFTVLLPHL